MPHVKVCCCCRRRRRRRWSTILAAAAAISNKEREFPSNHNNLGSPIEDALISLFFLPQKIITRNSLCRPHNDQSKDSQYYQQCAGQPTPSYQSKNRNNFSIFVVVTLPLQLLLILFLHLHLLTARNIHYSALHIIVIDYRHGIPEQRQPGYYRRIYLSARGRRRCDAQGN